MSDQTSPDAGAVASEAPNPEVEQDKSTDQAPDTQAGATDEATAVERTYTKAEMQEQVERASAKAAAKAERRAYREALQTLGTNNVQQQHQPPVDARPTRANGESDDAYLDRLTDWKLDQRERAGRQRSEQEQRQTLQAKTERLYAEAAKQPGFEREDFDELPLTPMLAKTLLDSDQAPKLMAFMAANPEEVTRIASLSEARQAAEIGKLEARLATSSPSRAPAPINPISGGRGSGVSSLESANLSEYEKLRAQQGAPWARRR